MKQIALLFIMFFSLAAQAFQLRGVIRDTKGVPVPYVSVYKEKTTHAVTSNIKGEYFIELPTGTHNMVFQALGYEKKTVEVTIESNHKILDITINEKIEELSEVQITAEGKDPAYEIIRNAIKARDKYRKPVSSYTCAVYLKASVEKEYLKKDTSKATVTPKVLTKEKMNFIESRSQLYVEHPAHIKEIKEAHRDLSEKHRGSVSTSLSFGRGEDDSRYIGGQETNRDLFKTNIAEADFNFYYNNLDIPVLSTSPFVSPISAGAFLSYKYKLEEYFLEDGYWVNKIKVIPRRTDAALFSGYIYIVDKLWCIKAVNLEADKAFLNYYNHFNIIQKYDVVRDSVWMLSREEFIYNHKMGKETIFGNTFINYSNYALNTNTPAKFFKNEVSVILDDAYEKDSAYWQSIRPITLKTDELKFIHTQDSIDSHHNSAEFKQERDSIVNAIKWYDILFGMSFRNSFKKQSVYINGIVNSANPFGIGGFRYRAEGSYNKELKRGHDIIVNSLLNYGFTNKDLKGYGNISYLYAPKRFGRAQIKYSNEYGFLNSYESVTRTFSMSNYVNQISYGIGNELEIVNGLYVDAFAEWVEKTPIEGIAFSKWSQEVFKADNTPPTFESSNLALLDLRIRYTIKQQYKTEPYKKINLGSKYPTIIATYRKGINGLWGSVANFDFVQVQIKDEFKIGTAGISKWNVYTGKYLNNQSILLTENKFFRGSDRYFFSDPLKSFQLLGPSLNTNNEFLEAHYLHRFNGTLLNKIPLIKKLKLLEVGGAGILLIKDNAFKHIEMYGGLEKVIRIKRQRFKIGAYYVVSDSNFSNLKGELKFGIDFFNSFTNSWSY